VLGLNRVGNADPQEFVLVLEDLENKKSGYIWTTEYGTEPEVRAILKNGGKPEPKVDALFNHAQAG
jgi:hypothetical protein